MNECLCEWKREGESDDERAWASEREREKREKKISKEMLSLKKDFTIQTLSFPIKKKRKDVWLYTTSINNYN